MFCSLFSSVCLRMGLVFPSKLWQFSSFSLRASVTELTALQFPKSNIKDFTFESRSMTLPGWGEFSIHSHWFLSMSLWSRHHHSNCSVGIPGPRKVKRSWLSQEVESEWQGWWLDVMSTLGYWWSVAGAGDTLKGRRACITCASFSRQGPRRDPGSLLSVLFNQKTSYSRERGVERKWPRMVVGSYWPWDLEIELL